MKKAFLKWGSMRCLILKNEKIWKGIANMEAIVFLDKSLGLRLFFLIIRFITRRKFILEFGVEVQKLIFFLLLFFQKKAKFYNFFFKYIEMNVRYERFDYEGWRRIQIFLWCPLALCISFEVSEKIKHLSHFLCHFWDWREKRSKSRFHY